MIGKMLGNRYEILQKIGTGGMGDVYKAHCHKLDRIVAIKILKVEYNSDENFIRKFRRESLAAASISHPNIVGIYDVGSEEVDGEQIHYIVMEYIDGKTLKEIITENGPLKQSVALNYSIQIAEALKVAHAKGIVHRDIKSQNIMVTKDDRVKVTDFGIARVADNSTVTATNAVMGSVHYFSPEQARGAKVDNRSDIYSLGIVMFEMLTGRVPFDADNPVSVALMQVQSNLPLPSSINPAISDNVDKMILKMCKKNPDDRYKNADELIGDIKAIILNRSDDLTFNKETRKAIIIGPETGARKKKVIRRDTADPYAQNVERTPEATLPKKRKEQSSKVGMIIGILTAALFIALIIFVVPKVVPLMRERNEKIQAEKNEETMSIVPNLVGAESAKAENLAKNAGFKIAIGEAKTDLEHKDGEILSQDLVAGTSAKKNSVITVVINKLTEENLVPSLVDKNADEAKGLVEGRGYQIEITYEDSDKEGGTVLSQSPKAGETLEKGGTISVVVSKSDEETMLTVPNIKGMAKDLAIQSIEAHGFKVGDIKEGRANSIDKGDAFDQAPEAGETAPKGSKISFKVSIGSVIEEANTEPKQMKTVTISIPTFADGQDHSIKVEMINDDGRRNIKTEKYNGDGVDREVNVEAEVGSVIEIQIDNVTVESREIK